MSSDAIRSRPVHKLDEREKVILLCSSRSPSEGDIMLLFLSCSENVVDHGKMLKPRMMEHEDSQLIVLCVY